MKYADENCYIATYLSNQVNNQRSTPSTDVIQLTLTLKTGGHFACACVNPPNDNSVGASNLMAGNRKLARKITILLKAISLVL